MKIFLLVLQILGITILPSVLAVLIYFLFVKIKRINNINYWVKQIAIGIIFGCACVGAYFLAIPVNINTSTGAVTFVGNGTVSPLISGLAFGWPAGIVTALIGGTFRICLNDPLRYSVFASIFISGAVGALSRYFLFRNKRPKWYYAALLGLFVETSNFLLIFVCAQNIEEAYVILSTVDVACILSSALSNSLSIIFINLIDKIFINKEPINQIKDDVFKSKPIALKIQGRLFITTLFTLIIVSTSTFFINNRKVMGDCISLFNSANKDVSSTFASSYGNKSDITSCCNNVSILESGFTCIIYDDDKAFYDPSSLLAKRSFLRNQIVSIQISKGSSYTEFKFDDGKKIGDFINMQNDKNGGKIFVENYQGKKYLCSMYKYQLTTIGKIPGDVYDFQVITFADYGEMVSGLGITLRVAIYTEIIAFIILYAFLNILVNKLIVSKLQDVNKSLEKITNGDLNEVVTASGCQEIEILSSDINSTVNALKNYASEVERRIEGDLELAKKIQTTSVPTSFPLEKEYEIYATMSTAKEVGGDFYDYVIIDDIHVLILIADVSGKGIPAALFMMRAKTLVKSLAFTGVSIEEIANRANRELCNQNSAGLFVTAWIGILDITTGEINYVNCGHCEPIVIRGKEYSYLKSNRNFVLAAVEDYDYKSEILTLKHEDSLLLYTDGVTEATNKDMELYGEERLLNLLKDSSTTFDCVQLLDMINDSVNAFQKDVEPADDVTMLCLKYYGNEQRALSNEITVKAKTENTTTATNFIKTFMFKSGINSKYIKEMAVVIDELFSNIAYYAYPKEAGNATIRVNYSDNVLKITFIDCGIPFDPSKPTNPNINTQVSKRKLGGLGLLIVHKSVDKMTYIREKKENIFVIEKNIK